MEPAPPTPHSPAAAYDHSVAETSEASEYEMVERFIPAPPDQIFDLLADPGRHRQIDGSGTVRDARTPSRRVALGDSFGMSMKLGVPYAMVSTVIEFEEDRCIAWQTRGPTPLGRKVAGRIWRYELEPVEGGTLVRESWDLSQESAISKPFARKGAATTRRNMEATLVRIEEVLAD